MSKADRAVVFAALGDPMRLKLLEKIGDGRSITQLAASLPITRQAVSQHLRVLEGAKLVAAQRRGREVQFVARPARLRQAQDWLDDVANQWDGTLGRLKLHVERKKHQAPRSEESHRMSDASIEAFRRHIVSRGYALKDNEWDLLTEQFAPVSAARGDVLLDSAIVTQDLFFVCDGIAASIQTTPDGDAQIARFFEHGQFCSNITSAWRQSVSHDQLVAMTDFTAVRMPFSIFRDEFMSGDMLAMYLREMVFETLLFDKDVLCAKTVRALETRYQFLAERYDKVVSDVPDKHIARFLGVTPQGLSRFLKNSRRALTQANVVADKSRYYRSQRI